jgi:hypothetical protein
LQQEEQMRIILETFIAVALVVAIMLVSLSLRKSMWLEKHLIAPTDIEHTEPTQPWRKLIPIEE